MSTNPRREELKALSQGLSMLKKEGAIDTINEALAELYSGQGFKELKSLKAWNKEGRLVKKGEKAFLLWGKPKQRKKEEQPPQSAEQKPEEEKNMDFFPVAYVFDITQTIAKV